MKSERWIETPVNAMSRSGVDVFFPGNNLTTCRCPARQSKLPSGVWQTILGSDYDENDGFLLVRHAMPCCGDRVSVNELAFEWPLAFGRFALEITNPPFDTATPKAADALVKDIAPVIGCDLIAVVGTWDD